MKQLRGLSIVVTGASRGLGRAFAREAAREGARVCLTGVHPERGAETAEQIRAEGGEALYVPADVTDGRALGRLADELARRWGRVDGLVNNAALAENVGGRPFDQISEDEWDRVMVVNARGPWLVTKALFPLLRASGRAKVVNLASDTALYGTPRLLHYVCSKGAVIAMTRALARELGEFGICVNCVAPGLTRVEATASIPDETRASIVRSRALRREQEPGDVVGAVMFLLSPAAEAITGQLLAVNSGFVLH